MNSDREIYPKIITDEPVIADGLDSHYRIADAIRSLINKSDGGKTIGVEGAWGSGKSTVIKIFESILSDKDGIQIYKFDAWTHQGEPLRRAFLEGLFENIIKSKWFQTGLTDPEVRKKWTAVKNELALKIKNSTKTIVPEFDASGIVLLLSFLCFPLGSSILTSAIAKGDASNFALAIGGIVISIPFVFVYCVFARIVLNNRLPSVRNAKIQEALGKLFQKGFITDVTKTIESIDPTTIEFQAKFSEFMQDALQHPGKKLVIVIDNLDRISEKEVEAIWPILRSFVDNPEFASKDWFKRFWVIIPFAPSSLKPLTENKEVTSVKDSPGRQAGFLDKVIQINFSVPTPTLSNLNKYIDNNLKSAFGSKITKDDVHKVFFIISNEVEKKEQVTPRLVISVINNMVATALQWGNINIVSHAYYSVLRRTKSINVIASEISGNLLKDSTYDGILPESIALDLAVLSCNVEISIAAQKLYGDDLEKALIAVGGGEKLAQDYKKIGFSEVMSMLLAKNLDETKNDPVMLLRKISNLMSIELSKIRSEHWLHLLSDVRVAIAKLSWFSIGSDDFIKLVVFLAENDNENFFLKDISKIFKNTKESLETNSSFWNQIAPAHRIVKNWIQIRDDEKLNRYFSREVTSGNILDLLSIPGPFGSWVDICNELGEANYIRNGFPPKLPLSEIFREMKTTSNFVQPVQKYIHSYRSLLENNIIVPDDVIINAYVDRVGRLAELPLNEALVTLPFLFDIAAKRKQIYSSLVSMDTGWVFYYFSTIFVEKPRRSKDSDMPVLSPEESGDLIAPKVIANLLFLWVLQGMNNDETKLNDQSMINGLYFLRKCINGHDQESEIIHQMRILFSKNEEWSKMINRDGLKIWAGKPESVLQFIRRFH